MYALNETSRILALLIFPMEIFRMRWGILNFFFLEFLKFPLIILFENEHYKLIRSIKKLNSVFALITI